MIVGAAVLVVSLLAARRSRVERPEGSPWSRAVVLPVAALCAFVALSLEGLERWPEPWLVAAAWTAFVIVCAGFLVTVPVMIDRFGEVATGLLTVALAVAFLIGL